MLTSSRGSVAPVSHSGNPEASGFLEARPEEVGLSAAGLENVSALVQGYVAEQRLAGAITLVMRHGRVAFADVSGVMDVRSGTPMRADALFRLFSMTKPLASTALMTLYEKGEFQLDQPISDFLPEFQDPRVFVSGTPESWEGRAPASPVTVRHVLSQTTGFASGGRTVPGQMFTRAELAGLRGDGDLKETLTLEDMMAELSKLPLEFDPGSHWRYGVSPDVAARLCEVIGRRSFDAFLRDEVLEPLGMSSTNYWVSGTDVERLTTSYGPGADGDKPFEVLDAPGRTRFTLPKTYFSGSGGLLSTAADYLQFLRLLTGHVSSAERVLGPRTVELMMQNHLCRGEDLATNARGWTSETVMTGVGFGLGFSVLLDPVAAQTIGSVGEAGWGGAASTAFFVSPQDDLAGLFLTQFRPSDHYPIRRQLRAAIYASLED